MAKMKKSLMFGLSICLVMPMALIFWMADYPSADVVPVPDGAYLIEHAKQLDGQEVVYQGEIVGDVMARGGYIWINVLNNGTAIGLWITRDQGSQITLAGRYGVRGDTIRAIGQFNQACAEHGGDLDLHVVTLEIIEPGYVNMQPLDMKRLLAAAVLLILAAGTLTYFFLSRKRKRGY
jgi:hypothetical protein